MRITINCTYSNCHHRWLSVGSKFARENVNDNACIQIKRCALRFFASKHAPTGSTPPGGAQESCWKTTIASWCVS
ncbi:hypothetical protein C1X27_24815 [Pseudomonas sp. MPR-AND1B]|nr:hypothetical protein C1X26_22380 [Pseudomonas sp. MPR-R3A]PMY98991.1 hypothetical protein C1X24_07950 [Pseudomonas sp. FW305-124]PMZ71131.1 hypothetical protein C1X25_15065 [Pseudomonas sp. GW247-3R2A]PNA91276.1 hypothetical protein C1X23_18685 [Pseudomonas sp. FW300-E2]PNA97208.1 hypothetical protein C1X27_24815 [Pseudomonas sp. MPR-AND1B]POH39923.1 hypothetical protein C2U56_18700 [Pseudomonas fluorescens]RZI26973.1 hypothetical protein EUX58_05410 [Pseudomonas sp. 770NI]